MDSNSIVLTHRPTTDHWLNFIANSPNKKHYRVRAAIKIINQEISDLRFNALKKTGGSYCQHLMNREANFLDKQLREVLS
jgi:hypothetical protein